MFLNQLKTMDRYAWDDYMPASLAEKSKRQESYSMLSWISLSLRHCVLGSLKWGFLISDSASPWVINNL